MKMKYIFLFILSIILLGIGYCYTFPKSKNTSHLFFAQYIQLENKNKPINWSLPHFSAQTNNNQPETIEDSSAPQKKHFISFSGCGALTQNPNSLSKKLKKEPVENTQNTASSFFQKMGCGLIQTIIPLSF